MKKMITVTVRLLIAVGLAVIIVAGWLLFKDIARTWGGYSFFNVYRENGTLEKEVCFKDGRFVRVTREYSLEGAFEKEWFNNGNYRQYFKNGKVQYELIKDKRNPEIYTIKTYHENGRLATKQVYRGARLLNKKGKSFYGVYRYFYQNGDIRKEESYKDGKMNGPWREYYKSGDLKLEFIADKENRYVNGKSYYESGRIESIIEQRLDGPVMIKYDPAGDPISEHNMF